MKIRIKTLEIENFKGIVKQTVNFGDITNISGDNGLGKTTVFDAFYWLLFDKDSKDRSKFDIKPLDENNQVIRDLNPTVTGILLVDGKELKLTKTYKEKWVKSKYSVKKQFKGNETLYEIDDVPTRKKDYTAKINEIANEEQFKLLSNPFYFANLNWKDKRDIVLGLGDNGVTVDDILKVKPELKEVAEEIKDKSLDVLIKGRKASATKLLSQKKEIPIRINEVKNSYVEVNESEITENLKEYETKLDDVKAKIKEEHEKENNLEKLNADINNKICECKDRIRNIEYASQKSYQDQKSKIESEIYKKKSEVEKLKTEINNKDYILKNLIARKNGNSETMQVLRNEFSELVNSKPDFSNIQYMCPTCNRPFLETDIAASKEEIVANFNKQLAKEKERINIEGKKLADDNVNISKEIDNITDKKIKLSDELSEKQAELSGLEAALKDSSLGPELSEKDKGIIAEIEKEIENLKSSKGQAYLADTTELENTQKELEDQILGCKLKLKDLENNKKIEKRIAELEDEERDIGIELSLTEKKIMLYELFMRTQIELLEGKINSKFKNVSFKMFDTLVQGDLVETCEALINGVPFSMANHAAQINAGLDIINTLGKAYNVEFPTFVDNAEAVNKIIDTEGQIITLTVSEDSRLKIESIEVATKEDIKLLEKAIDDTRAERCNSDGYSAEDYLCSILPGVEHIYERLGEHSRWTVAKTIKCSWKNVYIYISWDAPTTEMQEGMDDYNLSIWYKIR